MTIYDVAAAAGVAASTVSRTFARPGRVNAETAARIRAAADRLGYRRNPLPTGPGHLPTRTRLIATVVSDIGNPFYADLVNGAQDACAAAGYVMVLADAQESGTIEREEIERLLPVVDGFVIGSSRMPDSTLRNIAKQKPTVILNRALRDVPSVISDSPAGTQAAVAHLARLGHDSISYLAGPEAAWPDGVRWRSLRDTAQELGIRTTRLGPFPPTFQGGRDFVRFLPGPPPTALVAYNDLMALGAMEGLRRAGWRVPRDVSVIGFDDILTSRLVTPPLTTVAAPREYMGKVGVQHLLAALRNRSAL